MICHEWLKVCPAKRVLPPDYNRVDIRFNAMDLEEVEEENSKRKAQIKELVTKKGIEATFQLSDDMKGVRATLYWENTFKEHLSLKPLKHNTFPNHKWIVKVNDQIVKTWVIKDMEPLQHFVLTWEDILQEKEL
eukprot:CAMPEP_0182428920 /NCGR_PEP_ID=MMETSP1167-20130531/24576_1 /TAXON_ID=2988 /ORGANISM="Mallomonas Sp, Strain CCMP3275" /LENGTH=133 /DNA_ID=CAMNT_0024612137 /DNA_START=546 /DNA_END=947 /DNA_ORIENTATION=+